MSINIKNFLFTSALIIAPTETIADNLDIPGLFYESAPAGRYQTESGAIFDVPLLLDTNNDSGAAISANAIATVPANRANQKSLEKPGLLLDIAPTNKYKNKSESAITEVPLFLDDSTGTAANVPLSPYVILELDLDPGPGGVSFQDAVSVMQIGFDSKIGNGWTLGGSAQASYNNDGINGSETWNNSGQQNLRFRFQAGYGTSFGLTNIIRLDQLIWTGGGSPSSQTQRIEEFLRYTTQYNDTYYQFVGQRLRMNTAGGYDYRIFGGQGFNFTDRDNLELSVYQQWTRLGGIFGGGMSGNMFSTQEINSNYSHTFANKVTLYGAVLLQGSTFGANKPGNPALPWNNAFGAEAGIRVPF